MSDDNFARQFQSAAGDIVRMYSTCFTLMEIEMGSAPALALAPHYLGDVVAAAERLALSRLEQVSQPLQTADELWQPAVVGDHRRQLTIDDALTLLNSSPREDEANGGAPW
jgi:hypothetical protein